MNVRIPLIASGGTWGRRRRPALPRVPLLPGVLGDEARHGRGKAVGERPLRPALDSRSPSNATGQARNAHERRSALVENWLAPARNELERKHAKRLKVKAPVYCSSPAPGRRGRVSQRVYRAQSS